jgi:hypothetical protein
MSDQDDTKRICRLFTAPLLCPVGLIALIVAHVLLAIGEVVLALTHHDLAYLVLFVGDLLALLLICVKAYRRMRRAKPKVPRLKYRGPKASRIKQPSVSAGSLAGSAVAKTGN